MQGCHSRRFNCSNLKDQIHLCPSFDGEQGWRSGESTRLPPIWPRCDSRTLRNMLVEFVVGSSPCSEGFSLGTSVFLPPQKPTPSNSNSTWNAWTHLNELFGALRVNKLHLHIHFCT